MLGYLSSEPNHLAKIPSSENLMTGPENRTRPVALAKCPVHIENNAVDDIHNVHKMIDTVHIM